MTSKHIAFFLEQAYGHILPTVGVSIELQKRGHRVSYAVAPGFAAAIARHGAKPVVFQPEDTRTLICRETARPDGYYDFNNSTEFNALWNELSKKRTQDSQTQLEALYRADPPDLVVHDDCLDLAGRSLAEKFGARKVRHLPCILPVERLSRFTDELIIVPVPRFFAPEPDRLDERFHFVGFIAEGRSEFFEPFPPEDSTTNILAMPTTGLLPQRDFCALIIKAFANHPSTVLLSIGGFDPISYVDPQGFPAIPKNFRLNRNWSNLDMLKSSMLLIGQGGQGTILEAMYSGVPSILLPPSQGHEFNAQRVVELGLGRRISFVDATPELVAETAAQLLQDENTLSRVRNARNLMLADGGAKLAADLIESRF